MNVLYHPRTSVLGCHLYCTRCDIKFIGSVAFDKASLEKFYVPPLRVALSRNTHCWLLRDLTHPSGAPVLCVDQHLDEVPSCSTDSV